MIEKERSKSIYYKVSINIGPFCFNSNTRVYDVDQHKSTIVPGLKYSLITILFGWWGFCGLRSMFFFKSIRNSIEALHINFTGGEDISKIVDEYDFDEYTNYIWNNLLRRTKERLKKEDVEIILEIQNEFVKLSDNQFSYENIDYTISNLSRVNIYRASREDLYDIFDAIKLSNGES